MEGTTLMYGVGATKAGTSWLYRYLCDHPECALPDIKELHYFDRTAPHHLAKELTRLATVRADLLAKTLLAGKGKAAKLNARIDEVEAWIAVMEKGGADDAAYLDFLGRGVTKDTRVIGDITPAYGMMDEAVLTKMAGLTGDSRFIMLLRDPLDRLWSNLRMMAGWKAKDGGDIKLIAEDMLFGALAGLEEAVMRRSDYTGMITRLRKVIPAERLHFEFFEDLFSQTAVDKICTFLGLTALPGKFGDVVHASPSASLSPAIARETREVLLPHYDFVEAQFGSLPDRWQQNRKVLA